ncbi:winged helix-turn-helix transcriptional regulator, partial [Klebsiella quasipneumoniae]|nr:winged helix-turn-helix transcriptional regulator [Klebsiella quasipneumoniae]
GVIAALLPVGPSIRRMPVPNACVLRSRHASGIRRCSPCPLTANESVRLSDLRRRIPEASPTTMSQRLDELVDARIVTKGRSGYRLTTHGAALLVSLGPLELWAKSWKLAHRD